ncbi:MAG TPA: STAS/SEC14 domain-containing protein [Acidiferrobacter sp.]|nr:STAS/SEC14 domain-containing protein [Acidiferrobacter sp.]
MITLMPGLPSHVIGLVASGQVTAQDYESVVIPAVEATLKRHERVRLFYHIGPECTGFSTTAMWDDLKVGFSHMMVWERVAVVTDIAWIRTSIKLLGFTIGGLVRIFSNDEMAAAREWILGA